MGFHADYSFVVYEIRFIAVDKSGLIISFIGKIFLYFMCISF